MIHRSPVLRRPVLVVLLWILSSVPGSAEPLASSGSNADSLQAQLRRGEFVAAERMARAKLDRAAAASDSAAALDALVESLVGEGKARNKETRELAIRSLELCKKRKGPDDPAVADALCRLGQVLWSKGAYGPPRSLAASLFRFSLGVVGVALDSTLYDTSLRLETDFEHGLPELTDPKDYARALQVYRSALDIRRRQAQVDEAAVSRNLLAIGMLLRDRGEYVRATSSLEEALALRRKAGGEGEAECLFALADLKREWASYGPAAEDCERGLALVESSGASRDPDLMVRGLTVLGDLFAETGQVEDAQDTYRRALHLSEAESGNTVATAHLLLALARGEDPGSAQALCQRALGALEASLGSYHLDVSTALLGLASAQAQRGQYEKAGDLCERALGIRQRALGSHHPSVGRCLVEYGDVETEDGNSIFADSLYRDAIAIYQEVFGPDHPRTLFVEERRAELRTFLNAEQGAMDFSQAVFVQDRLRDFSRITLRSVPEAQAVPIASYFTRSLDSILGNANDPMRAWDALIRSRGLVLEEMGMRRAILRSERDSSIDSLWRNFTAARQRLSALLVRGASGDVTYNYWILLDEARHESERSERALAGKSASFRAREDAEDIDFADVRAVIRPDEALVGFCRYTSLEWVKKPSFWHRFGLAAGGLLADPPSSGRTRWVSQLGAFVLNGKNGKPRFISLASSATVDSLVAGWRREILLGSRSGAAPGAPVAGEALRRTVWDPLEKYFSGAQRVFLVPEGSLHLVNFAALPDHRGSYLVESGPLLHVLSAERALVSFQNRPASTGRGLLAVGGPDFDHAEESASVPSPTIASAAPVAPAFVGDRKRGAGEGCDALARTRFAPLPSTAIEAEEVARVWRDASRDSADDPSRTPGWITLLSGRDATDSAVKAAAPGRRALHFATHGFFLGQECPSALDQVRGLGTLLPDEDAPHAVPDVRPSALSGLAFAGANQRSKINDPADDGILTAEEISAMDLSSAEWVVLSACETGVGEIRAGEGVFGLRRAFEEAGARTLVLSLWPVEDASTREWMDQLYRARLQRGLGVSEAMREASLAVLRDRKEKGLSTAPFYWGAFVATGDWH